MPRAPARITQAEITRVVRGAMAAGLPIAGVRVDGAIVTILTETPPAPGDDLERARAEITARLEAMADATENPILPR